MPPDCYPDLKLFRGVFGIDLTTHVKAYKTNRPFVVDKCVEEIERRGMSVEGIYRVSGFQEEMDSLRLALDKGRLLITSQFYTFKSTLKKYIFNFNLK